MTSSLVDLIEHSVSFLLIFTIFTINWYEGLQSKHTLWWKWRWTNNYCARVQILASPRRNKNLSLSPKVSNSVQSTHAKSSRESPYPPLYFSPLPPTTLKYVLKTVLFVQTHLNPSQVPCFASVWQVLGFLTCEAPPPSQTEMQKVTIFRCASIS